MTPLLEYIDSIVSSKTPGMVIDVGAEYGTETLLSAYRGRKTYTFEPSAYNYAMVSLSIMLNNMCDRVHLIHAAADSEDGLQPFADVDVTKSTGAHVVQPGHTASGGRPLTMVRTMRIDNLLNDSNSDVLLLKVDAEMSDVRVLQGASTLISSKRVKNIIVEVSQSSLGQDVLLQILSPYRCRLESKPNDTFTQFKDKRVIFSRLDNLYCYLP